mmetsp:Transcript_36036/g.103623  ORF Transcript_36036/g.103623 Transcript_36036/m.103623 type:complete len:276 (+) Transcript_36036:788-1615(+)
MRLQVGIRQLRGVAAALLASMAGEAKRIWELPRTGTFLELEAEGGVIRDELHHGVLRIALVAIEDVEERRTRGHGAIGGRPRPTERGQGRDECARLRVPLAVLQHDEILVHDVPLRPEHPSHWLRDLLDEAGDLRALISEARAVLAVDVAELRAAEADPVLQLRRAIGQLLRRPLVLQIPPVDRALAVEGGHGRALGDRLEGGLLCGCGLRRGAFRFLCGLRRPLGRGQAPAQLEQARVVGLARRGAGRGVAASARFRAVGGRRRGGRGKSGEEP